MLALEELAVTVDRACELVFTVGVDPTNIGGRWLDRVEAFLGYPMLNTPLGAAAALLGDRRRSTELFELGYAEYVRGPFLEVDEYSRTRFPDRPRAGPFMANVGGFLSACLYWLPRMRPSQAQPGEWFIGRAMMPDLWEGIEVDRVLVRGREARLMAYHDQPGRFEFA